MNAQDALNKIAKQIPSDHVDYSDEFEQSQSLRVYNHALKFAAERTGRADVKQVVVEAYSECITLETAIKRAFN